VRLLSPRPRLLTGLVIVLDVLDTQQILIRAARAIQLLLQQQLLLLLLLWPVHSTNPGCSWLLLSDYRSIHSTTTQEKLFSLFYEIWKCTVEHHLQHLLPPQKLVQKGIPGLLCEGLRLRILRQHRCCAAWPGCTLLPPVAAAAAACHQLTKCAAASAGGQCSRITSILMSSININALFPVLAGPGTCSFRLRVLLLSLLYAVQQQRLQLVSRRLSSAAWLLRAWRS